MRNWRDPDEYAFTEDLKPWQWAWQFLRRNPKYRDDFQTILEKFNAREDEYSQRVSKRLAPGEEPESIPNAECRRKWFIWYYLNPKIELPTTDPFVEIVDLYMSNTHLWPLQPHEATLRLDLQLPLVPQLELARAILAPRQRNMSKRGELKLRQPRRHRHKWPLYLRLLDGVEVGASYKDLAWILPSPPRADDQLQEKRVDDHLKQAKRLYKKGYRDILLAA